MRSGEWLRESGGKRVLNDEPRARVTECIGHATRLRNPSCGTPRIVDCNHDALQIFGNEHNTSNTDKLTSSSDRTTPSLTVGPLHNRSARGAERLPRARGRRRHRPALRVVRRCSRAQASLVDLRGARRRLSYESPDNHIALAARLCIDQLVQAEFLEHPECGCHMTMR
jgi:hypothetical protein